MLSDIKALYNYIYIECNIVGKQTHYQSNDSEASLHKNVSYDTKTRYALSRQHNQNNICMWCTTRWHMNSMCVLARRPTSDRYDQIFMMRKILYIVDAFKYARVRTRRTFQMAILTSHVQCANTNSINYLQCVCPTRTWHICVMCETIIGLTRKQAYKFKVISGPNSLDMPIANTIMQFSD